MLILVRADEDTFRRVAKALASESDGKELKRDLARNLRIAVRPAVNEVRGRIRAAPSVTAHPGVGLRAAIARSIRSEVTLGGRRAGVRVKAGRAGMPRGFVNAPRHTNRASWRHPTFNPDVWVDQTLAPGWFDAPLNNTRPEYRRAVAEAMRDCMRRAGGS